MQHLRLANYKITKGTFPELVEVAKEPMLRTFKAQPGFVRYGIADTGEGTFVSISLWETHAQAEAAAPVAPTWVRENMADRIEPRSNQVGALVTSSCSAASTVVNRYRAAASRTYRGAAFGSVAVPVNRPPKSWTRIHMRTETAIPVPRAMRRPRGASTPRPIPSSRQPSTIAAGSPWAVGASRAMA